MDSTVVLFLGFFLGASIFFIIGWGCGRFYERDKLKTVGTLRIDSSDLDGPYLFLELSEGLGAVQKEEYVNLRVNCDSYISQK